MSIMDRTVGGFPLSIGTSLSFESLFAPRQPVYDPERQIPNKVDINHYGELWINLETLYRNIVGSVEKSVYESTKPTEIKDVMEFEMDIIRSLLEVEGGNTCKPVFYCSEYAELDKLSKMNFVALRTPTTDNQKFYEASLRETLDKVFKYQKSKYCARITDTFSPIDRKTRHGLVITHYPYDLLSYPHFSKLDLLESHTGKLKPRNLWYTKYHPLGTEELNTLPFLKVLLVIFGDHVKIRPYLSKVRKQIFDISKRRNWTPVTTSAKVQFDLDLDLMDPLLKAVLRSVN